MLCKAAAAMFCCVKLKVALLVLPQYLFMDTVSRGETAPAVLKAVSRKRRPAYINQGPMMASNSLE